MKNKESGQWLIFLALIFIISCNKIVFPPESELPIVEMAPSEIDGAGKVQLRAHVYDLGDKEITSANFNWYPADRALITEEPRFQVLATLSMDSETGASIDRDIFPGMDYAARLVIDVNGHKIYSDTVQFASSVNSAQPWDILFNNFEKLNGFPVNGFNFVAHDRLFMGRRSGFETLLWEFDFSTQGWQQRTSPQNGFLINGSYFSIDGTLYGVGLTTFNSSEKNGIWRFDEQGPIFQRLGDFPVFIPEKNFRFVIDGKCYFANDEMSLYRFSYANEIKLDKLGSLPFNPNASKYYGYGINGKGYVFFVKSYGQDLLDQVEWWSFTPETGSWEKMPDLEITARNFLWVTGQENFLLIGAGVYSIFSSGNFPNALIRENGLWKLNLQTGAAEFLGWLPYQDNESGFYPVFLNGRHIIAGENIDGTFGEKSKLTLYSLDLKKLAPY